ncbi:MAG TPA: ThuA domain-containing protein [Verrucomicrobiota bacterium]|nr:ThuA domain-containing protein [Verrucomicrobiota bacterium]HRZ54155.1 ThuA domain-containing protein [Candidatus Paceibacterota bacterium]
MKGLSRLSIALHALGLVISTAHPAVLELHTRERVALAAAPGEFRLVEKTVAWDAAKTAIIVCDMWDRHWCRGATARVAEMAPRMNTVLEAARRRGILIIHAPSGTMAFYADSPQRKRAREAPEAPAPDGIGNWHSLDRAKEGPLPIDDSDGGCDDTPQCSQGSPWRRQIAALDIGPDDCISDSGREIFNLLEQRGIENLVILGVHANMCVLGRPFSIRAMVGLGKNVVLMRDLTDTMYNSRRRPWVSHFVGTDLVVEHIEKHWCPSITSVDFLGGEPFQFRDDRRARIVFILAENEYRTWETVPAFARQALAWRGYRLDFVTASPRTDDYDFKNYTAIEDADLVFVSARRRAVPVGMLALLRRHLESGKPFVGLRTASHAFAPSPDKVRNRPELAAWAGFDAEVLGGNYHGHHPAGRVARIEPAPNAASSPLLTGVSLTGFQTPSSLYRNAPLPPASEPLLLGTIADAPTEPVAWSRVSGPRQSRVFYTSLGGPEDFGSAAFQRLLLNGILWALDQPIPPVEAPVLAP